MRWDRRQYLDLMTFGHAPRPMFSELFGPLVGLAEEWTAQGASPAELDLTAFDWDYVPTVRNIGWCGPQPMPARVISDTPLERVEIDHLGRTTRLLKQTATIPLPLDFPVRSMDDWLAIKPRFAFAPWRVDEQAAANAVRLREEGYLVVVGIPGAFDMPRELMGEEAACLAYYDQPELMHDILDTLRDTSVRVLRAVGRLVRIDQLSVHEDFAGRTGPLVGPQQVREFFAPYYRAAWDVARENGAQLFQQDTDGNINAVLDELLDCGLNSIFPMEPAAGMDAVQVRRRFGRRLAMLGGIDKHVLRQGNAAIRAELEYKLRPEMRSGMVFGLDHRIPNGTPLEAYRFYVRTGREILGLPPLDGRSAGWGRMAF